MHSATLPGSPWKDPGESFLNAFVGITDRQFHILHAASDQRTQEFQPESFILASTEVKPWVPPIFARKWEVPTVGGN